MFQKCFKSVSKLFQSCLFALKSQQLPEHMEGLFSIGLQHTNQNLQLDFQVPRGEILEISNPMGKGTY